MGEEARGDATDEMTTTYNILFVCTGNTCRSPMAAAIARHAAQDRGWSHVSIASAGVAAGPGSPAAEAARRVAAERGLDLDGHRSQSVTPRLIDWADLVLTMTAAHAEALEALGAGEKVALLAEFAEADEGGTAGPVPDPFGGDDETYRTTFDRLGRMIDGVLGRLEPILSP